MRKAGEFIFAHKLYLVMMFMVLAFVYIIRDEYVVKDAFREQSEDYFFVTAGQSLEAEIMPTGDGLRSILFRIAYPVQPTEQFTTTISVSTENEVLYRSTFSNDTIYEISDVRGNAVEFDFGQVYQTDSSSRYLLSISSDAVESDNAFGFCADTNGNLWYRLSYLLLTKLQRKMVSFLLVFVFATALYFKLMRHSGKYIWGGVELASRKNFSVGLCSLMFTVSNSYPYLSDAG